MSYSSAIHAEKRLVRTASETQAQPSYQPLGGAMTPVILRQLWSLIETTQSQMLLKLDDASLIQWLLKRLKQERELNHDETDVISTYLKSKLSLIRDLAHERQSVWQETH